MSLLDWLMVLRRRWVLVLSITVLGIAAAAASVLVADPLYRSSALIRLQDTQKTFTGSVDGIQSNLGGRTDPLLSLLEVMRSELVLGDVADRPRVRLRDADTGGPVSLLSDVEIIPEAAPDTLQLSFRDTFYVVSHATGEVRGRYGERVRLPAIRFVVAERPARADARIAVGSRPNALSALRQGLSAVPRTSTDVVSVQFVAEHPQMAQAVLEEIVDAFHQKTLTLSRQQSQRQRLFVQEQLAIAEATLADAQVALSDFRSTHELYSSRTRLAAEQEGLMGVEVRREELLAEREFYHLVMDELERSSGEQSRGIGALIASPGMASNPVVSSLLRQILDYESQRYELTTGAGGVRDDHPDVLRYDELITGTQQRLLEAVGSQLQALDARIDALARLRQRGAQQMRALPEAEVEEIRLVQEVEAASRLTLSLESELQRARIAEAVEVGPVEVLERPGRAVAEQKAAAPLVLLMGLMMGLLVGAGSAFGTEYFNTSINRPGDLEKVTGVRGLAVIPRFGDKDSRSGPGGKLLRARSAGGGSLDASTAGVVSRGVAPIDSDATILDGGEAFRTLRTNLIFAHGRGTPRTAVVTSAVAAEGKTTTAVNLSIVFSQQGMTVLLVDADLRRPRLHEVFRVAKAPGLTDLLLGEADMGSAIRESGYEGVSILPAGTRSSTPVELLGGNRMRQLLADQRRMFDLIIFDSPPILAVTDAAILSVNTDGAILVVHAGHTDREAVRAAVQKLDAVGAHIMGAVLNDQDATVPRYDRHYSHYSDYASVS